MRSIREDTEDIFLITIAIKRSAMALPGDYDQTNNGVTEMGLSERKARQRDEGTKTT